MNCPKCGAEMEIKKVEQPNPNHVKELVDCPDCNYYYYTKGGVWY